MSGASVNEIKKILMQEDVVESEVLPQLIASQRFKDVTNDEIADILKWCGEDEYTTVDDILAEAKEYKYVLVSQGIEIGRFKHREEAEAVMNAENEEYYKYEQECIDSGEDYADTEVSLFVEGEDEIEEGKEYSGDIDYSGMDYSVDKTVQDFLGSSYEYEMVSVAKDAALFQAIANEIANAHNKYDENDLLVPDFGEDRTFQMLLNERIMEGGTKELPDVMCDVIYDAYKYFINGEDISNNLPEPKPILIKGSPVKLEINMDIDGPHPSIEYKGKTAYYEKAGDAKKLIEQAMKEKDEKSL